MKGLKATNMTSGQFDIDFGRRLRDRGIALAVDHADKQVSQWSQIAYDHFLEYLRRLPRGHTFMIEDFRHYMGSRLVEPPSLRAYGAIAVRGAKYGLIKRIGYQQVKNSTAHRTPAAVWEKL